MALIICKNCGKTVSDTVDVCIHCGENIKSTEAFSRENNQEPSFITEKDTAKPILKDFTFYSAEEQIALEKEFLSNDGWAKKYRQRQIELPSFLRTAMLSWGWAFIIIAFSFKINESLLETMFTFSPASEICVFSAIASTLLLFITILCRLVIKIRLRLTFAKYIYMKKFQVWLYKEKSVNYIPPITKFKEQQIFKSIDLNSLGF